MLRPDVLRMYTYESLGTVAPSLVATAHVKVRWREDLGVLYRTRLEQKYRLHPTGFDEQHTWNYELHDVSRENVAALVKESEAVDTAGIDRTLFLVIPGPRLLEPAAPHHLAPLPLGRSWQRMFDPIFWTAWLTAVVVGGVLFLGVGVFLRRAVTDILGAVTTRGRSARTALASWLQSVVVPTLARLAKRSLLFDVGEGTRMSLRDSLLCVGFIAAIIFVTHGPDVLPTPELTNDFVGLDSVDLSVNRVHCGVVSSLGDEEAHTARYLVENPDKRQLPLRDVVLETIGSLDAHCGSLQPYRNEENSPTFLMTGILYLQPSVSLDGLGSWVLLAKLGLVATTWVLLLRMGCSLLSCYLGMLATLTLMDEVSDSFVNYSFFFILLSTIGVGWSFALAARLYHRPVVHACFVGLMGWLTAFGANMRTSHLPIYSSYFVLYMVFVGVNMRERNDGANASGYGWLWRGTAAFVAGTALFWIVLIRPIDHATATSDYNYTYHPIAHPLVLSLSLTTNEAYSFGRTVSGNDLARREGISWYDPKGLDAARKVYPDVEYLDRGYERALWTYYGQLWRRYPQEMVRIYVDKFQLAGRNIRGYFDDMTWSGWLPGFRRAISAVWPLGLSAFWVLAVTLAIAIAHGVRRRSSLSYCLSFLTLAACIVYMEAALTVPQFVLKYYNYLAWYLGVLSIVVLQMSLNVGHSVFVRLKRSTLPPRPA